MTVKKKKLYLTPSLPKKISRYRNINNSSSYLPYIYHQTASPVHKHNLIILDEQEENSSGE
ncbi:MAG: hypothetical protein C4582_08585 [Desulfobacteraceae bacterium]|jgi:hypothetical protein|nr:MAG: hypothetical protein C4582_08585 [Desulfobacteraceae bacterium]